MKVFIIESSGAGEFYSDRLDGEATRQLLRVLWIPAHFRFALDLVHLKKAIKESSKKACDVLHVSSHGTGEGISLANDDTLSWAAFADIFEDLHYSPNALVMSCCWGATDQIAEVFEERKTRPSMIVGTTTDRYPHEYAVAWAMLYSRFEKDGVEKDNAQQAMKAVSAFVHNSFRYLRWDGDKRRYLRFPGKDKRYEITEVEAPAKSKLRKRSRGKK